MSKDSSGKVGFNSGVVFSFSKKMDLRRRTTGRPDDYDEDERDLEELEKANLDNPKYDNARKFIDTLYATADGITFEYFMRDKNGVTQRPIPNSRPEIKAVVTDWDGTVGNLYEKQAKAIWEFIRYIGETRKIDIAFLQDYLKEGGRTEEFFTSYDFFSLDGLKNILSSAPFSSFNPQTGEKYECDFSKSDMKFLEGQLNDLMYAAYSHVYPDAIRLFHKLQAKNVPIFVHTDSPFSELVDKLIAVSNNSEIADKDKPIKFDIRNGKIVGVKSSVFVGFSVLYNLTPEQEQEPRIKEVLAAFETAGIAVIKNSFEERKPNPQPLTKIKSALNDMGYGQLQSSDMLMLGDILSKDGAFAFQNGMYYAWPGYKAKLSKKAVAVNRITAAGNAMHKNRILGQIRPFADKYLKGDEQNMANIAKTMAVCCDYMELDDMFRFEQSRGFARINAKVDADARADVSKRHEHSLSLITLIAAISRQNVR